MIRKESLNMGVNSKKKDMPDIEKVDTRLPPYDVNSHFDHIAKLCHHMLTDMKTLPKLTMRPKKTSNNLKIDDFGEGEKPKYIVPTFEKLLKLF